MLRISNNETERLGISGRVGCPVTLGIVYLRKKAVTSFDIKLGSAVAEEEWVGIRFKGWRLSTYKSNASEIDECELQMQLFKASSSSLCNPCKEHVSFKT